MESATIVVLVGSKSTRKEVAAQCKVTFYSVQSRKKFLTWPGKIYCSRLHQII